MKLSEAREILSRAGIESALYDARIIFSDIGGIPIGSMIGSDVESDRGEVIDAIRRRACREPLQYILGYTDFYRERYEVSSDCLIPREDTEALVDYAVGAIPEGESFLDLCTGSGCVAVSTLANTKGTFAHLVDISEAALALARRNAERNGVADRASFERLDLMESFPEGRYYAILSNPPYVSSGAYRELEKEISFEPSIAFLGGEDGGDFYRRLVPVCRDHLCKGGFIAFEIGYDQADMLSSIAVEYGLECSIINDLSGRARVAVLRERE